MKTYGRLAFHCFLLISSSSLFLGCGSALAGCGKREIFERIGPRAPVSATGEHSNHD
jgi:hypothetical protein